MSSKFLALLLSLLVTLTMASNLKLTVKRLDGKEKISTVSQYAALAKTNAAFAQANALTLAKKPNVDLCGICVDFMGQTINQLLNIILQAGLGGGCSGICSYLPNTAEQTVCMMVCEYVGVTEFGNLVNYEDPDPIFICEEFDMCTIYPNGVANITNTIVNPAKGPAGTTFNMAMQYTVTSHTGPGLLVLFINPPDGFPMSAEEFTEGQAPGAYQVGWSLQAQPNEDESFSPGLYQVQFAVCEGDCTTAHNWGGVYTQANNQFQITSS